MECQTRLWRVTSCIFNAGQVGLLTLVSEIPSIPLAYFYNYSAVTVSAVRVVCILAHLSSLHQITEHDNHSALPVINHFPEISASGLHGTLGYDKSSLLLVALNRE